MEDFNSKYSGEEVDGLLDEIGNKVDKVDGKQLSTEDFTTALKNKLNGLSNYDDTTISQAVEKLRIDLDALVSGDTTTAIKTFNEVIAFLDGISDTEDLAGIIASIEQQIAGKMDNVTLAKVATSGSYDDLTNKPTIPSEQVNADWNATSGKAQILNKPTIPSDDSVVHKTGTETISGAKTFTGGVNLLGSGDSNAVTLSTNTRINVNGTTKTVLGFGSGTFYINHGDYKLLLRGKDARPTYNNAEMAMLSDVNGKYTKPSTGIPKTDLASAVQTSLGKADSALQELPSEAVIHNEDGAVITQRGILADNNVGMWYALPFTDDADKENADAILAWYTLNGDLVLQNGILVDNNEGHRYALPYASEENKADADIVIASEAYVDSKIGSGSSNGANVQAVDTGDILDDVAVEYITKVYFDSVVGNINGILESIINGGSVKLISFTIGPSIQCQAEEGMTWSEWVDSEYNTINAYTSDSYVACIGGAIALNNTLVNKDDLILSEGYIFIA